MSLALSNRPATDLLSSFLDDVFGDAAYSAYAAWQWGETGADGGAEDISAFLANGPNAGVREYCVQYRETDWQFMQRLLASEGLGWRVEEAQDAPAGHRIVLFADSQCWPQNPTSQSALGGQGIKFQRAHATETQDAIQSQDFGHGAAEREFIVLRVCAIGINNLPKEIGSRLVLRL
ncbi:MAG: phage late control D family protein [Burkholderiales bacterium]|jgi:uncharacterized protein involved in type VI secretion and phage assembly|nr:phage late control D family protein [Burkholderiales bacterium]